MSEEDTGQKRMCLEGPILEAHIGTLHLGSWLAGRDIHG